MDRVKAKKMAQRLLWILPFATLCNKKWKLSICKSFHLNITVLN